MRTLALGLMSGTSMDGIDVAIVDVNTQELVLGKTIAYSKELSEKLKMVMTGQAFDMCFFASLHREVGVAFANAARDVLQELHEPISVVGMHGQTICHQTQTELPFTWQIGCPYTVYENLKVPVVFDFRSHNVVQGGEGAPLAPLYHQYLFANEKMVAVINIGGISNISLIRKGFPVIGYDLGPGNCLSDSWVAAHFDADFDKDGSWASQGKVSLTLVEELIKDPFFLKAYPKSIGKEYFSLTWLNQYIDKKILLPEDVQATLIALTARLIAIEVQKYLPKSSEIYVCGGGVKNKHLMNSLSTLLSDFNVSKTDEKGISSDYLEAMMMAWLGWTRIEGVRHDLSSMLGGADQQLLGLICQ